MNDAAERHLEQFEPSRENFRNCFRNVARGRTLNEVRGAARMLLAAKHERYVGFSDVLSEFSDAPLHVRMEVARADGRIHPGLHRLCLRAEAREGRDGGVRTPHQIDVTSFKRRSDLLR